ncbi:MAG: lytic murein transglycosylase [Pelagibacterales bacterium]|nr:lytic murein transglycosylase [Pelagibacterales bacterium]
MKIIKIIFCIILISLNNINPIFAEDFNSWIISFKDYAMKKGISKKTLDITMSKVKFLPKVIEYDRYQPEFYEDTKTYISKRTSNEKFKKGKNLFIKNSSLILNVESKFNVEKELLLSLMGIETNFGKYLGKMDILSSLATLSYDKRRSEFFTNELITILRLIDSGIVDSNVLYGSWAGAFGNFQFMPSTIKNYALDYNNDDLIDLKSTEDSFASAANYINKLGWKKNNPCFYKIKLKENIPLNYLNTSAKKIKNKKKFKYFKKYIVDYDNIKINENLITGIITPDREIVENSKLLEPAYLTFDNYELILKWNRSLRFALAVCTLKDKFKNEL